VESLLAAEHAGIARLERCELQGVLVGLGPAADEKQLVVVVAADASQSLGHLLLQFVDDGVGVEPNLLQLLRHLIYIMGVRVTDADDSMATIQVQILLALVVPNLRSLSLDDVHVE
jgi:hypothetical protein